MLSTIIRLHSFRRISAQKLLGNTTVQKHLHNHTEVVIDANLLGYTKADSTRYSRFPCEQCCKARRSFTSQSNHTDFPQGELDPLLFDKISEETLESLTEYFDELVEKAEHLQEADVSYGDGVLTIKFGQHFGTYVINRQTPNKQIWLSSPTSGPKRYDFVNGNWIYRHDGRSIHELLDNEIPNIVKSDTKFRECSYASSKSFNRNNKS